MIAPLLLLLAVLQAAPAAPPGEGQAAGRADPFEEERQSEEARRGLEDWGLKIARPNLESVDPIPELRRLRVVNRTGRTVRIDAADYPGRETTEVLSRTLRPGARATLWLTPPAGACRATLRTTPRLAHRSANLCRNAAIILRR